MVAISASNTRVNLWNNFNTFFTNMSWTITPTIKASYNDEDVNFPQLILHSINVPKNKITLDGSIEDRANCSCVFELHTHGGLNLDIILDEIDTAIRTDSTLESDGIQFKTDYWRESDDGTYLVNKQKIHVKVITLLFEITKTV